MYKCCWNCAHGARATSGDEKSDSEFSVASRVCMAAYPVKGYQNAYKRKYCTQFKPNTDEWFYHVTAVEASRLSNMTIDQLKDYWKVN